MYDADFTPARLAKYPALFMPLSLALSDEQARTAIEYARRGGTLVLGIGAGNLDAHGLPRERNLLGEAFGFELEGVPAPDGTGSKTLRLRPADGTAPIRVAAIRNPLRLKRGTWETLLRCGEDESDEPVAATREVGMGCVVVVDADTAATYVSRPVSGGETELYITDEDAAGGDCSLKYVDAAVAPQEFYPDLENHMVPFGTPECVGGELNCDLKVGADAHVSIEVRSSRQPIAGPMLRLGPDGNIAAGGQVICALPLDEWLHVRIAYEFATGDRDSTWEATIRLQDGTEARAAGTSHDPAYHRTDWLVVYGAGTQAATFHLDNLQLVGIKADGGRVLTLDMDFEEGPGGLQEPTTLQRRMAEAVKRYAPPPIDVQAPDHVRVGAFERDGGRLLIHLHDRNARRTNWLGEGGPEVVLRCAFAVREAKSALTGAELELTRHENTSVIRVPSLRLYEVVEIQR